MAGVPARPSLGRSLMAGLAAGAIAAMVASLVSLPLRSPDDVFFNTGSVTVGALLLGLVAGAVWWLAGGTRAALLRFILTLEALFLLVVVGALALDLLPESPLQGAILFIIPLALIAFTLVEALTPLLSRLRPPLTLIAAPVAVAALALGIALAGVGDAPSGELFLPESAASNENGQAAGAGSFGGGSSIIRRSDVAGIEFVIVPSESAATYTVREKLAELPLPNDAVGRTSAITGTIYLDGRPSKVVVDLRTLQSDQPRRDRFIREQGGLPFNRYPFAEFTVERLDNLPEEYRLGEIVRGDVTGTMKIRDVERPFTFATESRLTHEGLQIRGTGSFTWAEFQIPPPNIRGLVQVENDVRIEVLLIAKPERSG